MTIRRFAAQADRQSILRQLIGALSAFEALPGRYPLALREPRILFHCIHDVLLLAAGRPVQGLALKSFDAPHVKRAACFFVRTAMLRSGVDHYTLLGLDPAFHQDVLRDHYRMMIRLTHPDFVSTTGAWPTGAAARVNLAHDVLSSVVQRSEYDRTLGGIEKRRSLVAQRLPALLSFPEGRSRLSFRPFTLSVAGVAGAAAVLMLLTLWNDSPEYLEVKQVTQTDLAGSGKELAGVSDHAKPFPGELLSAALEVFPARCTNPARVVSKL